MNSVFTGIIHLTLTGLWADLKTRTNQNTRTLVHPKDYGFITLFPITGLSAPIYHFTGVGRNGQGLGLSPFSHFGFPFREPQTPLSRHVSTKITIYGDPVVPLLG
jgi:hypothetical protein